MMVAKPFSASSALFTPTSTPPASVLCRISGDTILSTTGKPIAGSDRRRFGGRRRDAFLGNGDAVRLAHDLAFGCGERGAAFGLDGVQNTPDFGLVVGHLWSSRRVGRGACRRR